MIFSVFLFSSQAISQSPIFPRGTYSVSIPKESGIRHDLLLNIAPIVQKSIAQGNYPGAVILAAHHGHIIYRGVFGNRRILPDIAPMELDTIFDIASLTKVVATTPAIMQLVEEAKLDLDAPVAKYWPGFAENGKEAVTIRELLTHMSGLPADIPSPARNEVEVLQQIKQLKLKSTPGTKFLYSDLNFVILAYLVEVVTGDNFDRYVKMHIFKPLNMENTFFTPTTKIRDRIAPTEVMNGELRWGHVHDPLAYSMGGVSGNAGLFSTAIDLGRYAECLLNGGSLPENKSRIEHLLGPLTILKMISPQTPPDVLDKRGLGWDIDSVYSNRGVLFPTNSFGHTGWTGTSIWIDPTTQTWIIILTNRVHPHTKNKQIVQDRRKIANIISASITDVSITNKLNTGTGEINRAYAHVQPEMALHTKKKHKKHA